MTPLLETVRALSAIRSRGSAMIRQFMICSAVALSALAGASAAQADPPKEYGDANSGRGIALLKCAECHGVTKEDKASPNLKAPPFMVIANSKMVTVREVDQWLQSAHADMPDMALDANARGAIIAYFRSLSPMDPMQ